MASSGRFAEIQAPVKVIHSNLDQEIIQITEDKLRLVLNEHIGQAEQRKGWIAPLSLLIAIATVFATSTFKDALFKAPTWEAFFVIAGLLSLGWLLWTVRQAWRSPSVQDIVEKIKNRAVDQ